MPYTLLRVTERGVVLGDYHARRLQLSAVDDGRAREAFERFAATAEPGVWAVWSGEGESGLRVQRRAGGSRLRDGMPCRLARSPVLHESGPLAKRGTPSAYDSVRVEGVATLLTSADGGEILEACCAAVVAWDGTHLLLPPGDRPRVWSTSEAAIRDHLPVREAALPSTCESLLLANAVKGTCRLDSPHGAAFPADVVRHIDELFERLTTRLPAAAAAAAKARTCATS